MKEVNQYLSSKAKTGKKLKSVKGICIHYYASPMAKATNVIKYWENQANGINAHDCIDLDGTIFHAVPYDEMCYQVGSKTYTKEALTKLSSYPNDCVIGIECGHIDATGKMTDETYNTLVQHTANLLKKFNLTVENLWLHKEVVGWKECHKWFTDNPVEWKIFKDKVHNILNPKEEEVMLNKDTANLIIKMWLKPAYEQAIAAGDREKAKRINGYANELRIAANLPLE